MVLPNWTIGMLEVRQNRDFPEQFSVLTTNEAVDGGGWRDVVCQVRERRIRGTFWDIWVRGGDRFQVAEDRGSLESYGRRREFHIPSVCSLGCAGLCEVVERPSDLDGMDPGGCTFATSSSKNLHLKLTSRLLLKGPRIFVSDDSGSARLGRLGGFCSCFCVQGDQRRAKVDPSGAVTSGEYTGGREDSTGGMIGGGSGADGSLRRGWRRLGLVGWA